MRNSNYFRAIALRNIVKSEKEKFGGVYTDKRKTAEEMLRMLGEPISL